MLLAYLPVKACLRQAPFKLGLWMFPLLLGISLSGGIVCYYFQIMTTLFLIPVLLFLMLLYHKTLQISIWKSSSIFLAVCAVFACVKSLSRAVNAIMIFEPDIAEKQLWLCVKAGIFYNLICLSFVLIAWYPAAHMVRILIADENFAQTWYIFLDPAVDFYRIKSIHGPQISEYFIYRADFTDLRSSQYCSFNNSDSLLCDISYDGIKSE